MQPILPTSNQSNTVGSEANYPTESYDNSGGSAGFVMPWLVQTGVTRGTQKIQNTDGSYILVGQLPNTNTFGIALYDNQGNLISELIGPTLTIFDALHNKSVVQGLLPTKEYGTAYFDDNGNMLQKIVGGTTYYYDPLHGNVNSLRVGLMPDGTYNWVAATTGNDVADIFD